MTVISSSSHLLRLRTACALVFSLLAFAASAQMPGTPPVIGGFSGPGSVADPDALKPTAAPRELQGTWVHREMSGFIGKMMGKGEITADMNGKPLPAKPEAIAISQRRKDAEEAGKPIASASTKCLPPGQTTQLDLNFPFHIFQADKSIHFVFYEFHGVWNIRMDQPHRKNAVREYMGDSVGHWEGDTLVVDTNNYKASMWLDVYGTPLSKNAHVIHRIRKIENGTVLEIVTTFDDPTLYTAPWSIVRTYGWRPDRTMLGEYNCENQLGEEDGVARYGAVEEE